MVGTLVIRADASVQMGTGHVMRSLALAQAWQDFGGQVVFAVHTDSPGLIQRLTAEHIQVVQPSSAPGTSEDAQDTIALAHKNNAGWVVIDGYHFDTLYQRAILNAALRLLVIDDYGHAEHYCADGVLNQNIYVERSYYPSRELYTHLLLGTQFALLRREFLDWRGQERQTHLNRRRVLVTMGGSDPENMTLRIVQALQSLEDVETAVVVGAANPNIEALHHEAEKSRNLQLLTSVTDMPTWMAWADVAISAAGSTCWELCFMGLPFAAVIVADNQQGIAEGLDQAGAAINLGWFHQLDQQQISNVIRELLQDAPRRQQMSKAGQWLVDGCGAVRAVQFMNEATA